MAHRCHALRLPAAAGKGLFFFIIHSSQHKTLFILIPAKIPRDDDDQDAKAAVRADPDAV
jgi:hypothetical protein